MFDWDDPEFQANYYSSLRIQDGEIFHNDFSRGEGDTLLLPPPPYATALVYYQLGRVIGPLLILVCPCFRET